MITSGDDNKLTYMLLSDIDRDGVVCDYMDGLEHQVPSTVYDIERPGGERDWGPCSSCPLYDTPRHTVEIMNHVSGIGSDGGV